jgi:antitoxin VapB
MPKPAKTVSGSVRRKRPVRKDVPHWETAKVFKHGGSQAIRLPKAFRFDAEEVLISREDDHLVLREKPISAKEILDEIMGSSPDFMKDRKQPRLEKREWWWE